MGGRRFQRRVGSYRALDKKANDIAASYLGASSLNKNTKRYVRSQRLKRLSEPKPKRKKKK
ncbi:hypothetical protein LCGC14_1785900 [marine sediment metagenome]|uniref:Uncharacterized protein n=1 Tax=marine sediment metagenome TaxID=412755 RepID=A0A0F9GU18_9ZZZZ